MPIHDAESLLAAMRGFQVSSVLAAAADLDVFNALAAAPRTGAETAAHLGCDLRAAVILLDALAAVGVLEKTGDRYRTAPALAPFLTDGPPPSVAAMSAWVSCEASSPATSSVSPSRLGANCAYSRPSIRARGR